MEPQAAGRPSRLTTRSGKYESASRTKSAVIRRPSGEGDIRYRGRDVRDGQRSARLRGRCKPWCSATRNTNLGARYMRTSWLLLAASRRAEPGGGRRGRRPSGLRLSLLFRTIFDVRTRKDRLDTRLVREWREDCPWVGTIVAPAVGATESLGSLCWRDPQAPSYVQNEMAACAYMPKNLGCTSRVLSLHGSSTWSARRPG